MMSGKCNWSRIAFIHSWCPLRHCVMGWQWHQLDHMRIICTSLQTDNYTGTSSLNSLVAIFDAKPTVSRHWRQVYQALQPIRTFITLLHYLWNICYIFYWHWPTMHFFVSCCNFDDELIMHLGYIYLLIHTKTTWDKLLHTYISIKVSRSQVRVPAAELSSNNLGQVVHTHVPLSPSSITWYRWKLAHKQMHDVMH